MTKPSKVDAKIDVKTLCMIDWIVAYIATRPVFILCPKELQPDTTKILIPNQIELVHKINSSNHGNNNLSILGDRHTTTAPPTIPTSSFTIIDISSSIGIGNHQHQPSARINHDLTIPPSCRFIISIISHRQLPCWPVITFASTAVAEPPKCLGPSTLVIVPGTSDGNAGDPPTLEVRWASQDAHSTAIWDVLNKLVLTTNNGHLTKMSSPRPYQIASGHLNTKITRCEDIAVSQTTYDQNNISE